MSHEPLEGSKAGPAQGWKNMCDRINSARSHRALVLFMVAVALFLDNMLLTTVVPIVPSFLMTTKVRQVVNQIIDSSGTNCTLKDRIITTLEDAVLHLSPMSYSGRAHAPLAMEDFLDTTRASRAEQKRIQQVLTQLDALAADCQLNTTVLADKVRTSHIGRQNFRVGMLFASKSLVQLIVNPFVGPVTNRIGYSIPMITGFAVMFTSTIIFAFGETYTVLLVARALQGAGSACSSVSGMGMLASYYTDPKERTRAFGTALSGLALGVLVGPTFGGIVYQFIDKRAPFLILAALALLDGLLQLIILKPGIRPEQQQGAPLLELLRDPYILIAAGSLTFGNMGIAILEPALPMWMKEHMNADNWAQGIAFLPASISYLLGTNLFGIFAHRIGHWLSALLGMLLCSVCLTCIPFSTQLSHLIVPTFGLGLSMGKSGLICDYRGLSLGMVDASMMPQMGLLVDLRHVAIYGSVYAIADVAFCLGFAIGPAISGTIAQSVGFSWTIWGIAIVTVVYSPLHLFLKNPPRKGELQPLNSGTGGAPPKANSNDEPDTNDFQLGDKLGYDPTDGGQKPYSYGD